MSKLSRRDFLKGITAGAGALAATSLLGGCATETECPEVEEQVCPEVSATESTTIDWLGSEPSVDEASIGDTWETDILIVGAGNGGMAAAAKAAEQGAKFRVIEQSPILQDTRHWYGAPNSKHALAEASKPVDTHKLLDELKRYSSGKADLRVVKTWMNEAAAMDEFIGGILEADHYHLSFTSGSEAYWPDDGTNSDYYFPEVEHWYQASDESKSNGRNEALYNYIVDKGYDVDFNTELIKLEKENGKVVGVIARNVDNNTYIRIKANKGVVIATGGYPGNPDMMKALDPLGTSVTTACSYSPMDRGYGIKAAIWAGAKLQDEPAPMLFDRGIVAPGVDAGYADNDQFPGTVRQFNFGTQPFLKVNRNGERFTNESGLYDQMSYAASHQPGHVYAQIFDANYMEDIQRFHTIGCSAMSRNIPAMTESQIAQMQEQGLLFAADSIEELADKLGLKGEAASNFVKTVARYNELYDAQNDDDFGKMPYRLSAIKTAPFYGCWLGASLLTTEQGISINEKGQALDADQNVIDGLYVIGDASGNFFFNNYPCIIPGTACGRTLTYGIKVVKVMLGIDE